jgi:hypothetical protein
MSELAGVEKVASPSELAGVEEVKLSPIKKVKLLSGSAMIIAWNFSRCTESDKIASFKQGGGSQRLA